MKQIGTHRITFGALGLLFGLVILYTGWHVFGGAAGRGRPAEVSAASVPKDDPAPAGEICEVADDGPFRSARGTNDPQPTLSSTPNVPTLAPPRPIEQVRGEVFYVTVQVETRRPADAVP